MLHGVRHYNAAGSPTQCIIAAAVHSANDLARELRVLRAEDLAQSRHVALAPLGQIIVCAAHGRELQLTRKREKSGRVARRRARTGDSKVAQVEAQHLVRGLDDLRPTEA